MKQQGFGFADAGFDFGGQAGFAFGGETFEQSDFRQASEDARRERAKAEYHRAKQASEERARQRQERQAPPPRPRAATFDPWAVLGLAYGSSQAAIRSAWIRLVKMHHPDHGGDAEMFRRVQAAYEAVRV
jgi:hypothetical protein